MNNESKTVIFLAIIGGTESINLQFNWNSNIGDLKEKLGKKLNTQSSDLALFFKFDCLDETKTLRSYNLGPNDFIHYIKLEHFQFASNMESLGAGDLSKVYLDRRGGIVIKEYVLKGDNVIDKSKAFLSEIISFMKLGDHPNVVKLLGLYKTRDYTNEIKFYIGLEYMNLGNVEKMISKNGPLSEKRAWEIMKVIVGVLVEMHDNKLIHRGIRGSSIYLNANNEIKLANFGFSKYLDGSNRDEVINGLLMSVPKLPTNWLAPEILKERPEYGVQIDIWGVGVTLVEMISGKKPYDYLSDFEASVAIQRGDRIKYDDSKISLRLKDIITKCTKYEPADRPSAEELLKLFN